MPSQEVTIKTITKASLKIDPMFSTDRTNQGEINSTLSQDTDSKKNGYYRPFIQINGHRIDPGLEYFSLDNSGFLPVCRISFRMIDPVFLSVSYPKDGDVFSVYIRAVSEVYRPIRMDFNVLEVSASSLYDNDNSDGKNQFFEILGECRIPGIYAQMIKSFRGKTSYDTLLQVSQDLGLGFASNDENLQDSMNWICPNFSYYDFIKTVTEHSYKDEYSYFDSWIDFYYNLNFVNLGTNYGVEKIETEIIKTPVQDVNGLDINNDTAIFGSEQKIRERGLVLSNSMSANGTLLYIRSYTLESESGQRANESGYVTTLHSYDGSIGANDPGHIFYDLESITVQNIEENMVVQKGRPTENLYSKEKRSVWLGENKTGEFAQTHDNYLHAKQQNLINLIDSGKFSLVVSSNYFLPFIYKGQVLPVAIYVKSKGKRKRNTGNYGNKKGDLSSGETKDNFLSGLYVVRDFSINFDKNFGIYQEIRLSKKTWFLNSSGELPKYYPVDTEL